MLDTMAQRYGKLPTEMLRQADSFDLMVFDVAVTYEQYISNKEKKQVDQKMYSQEDLQAKMDNARKNENKI